MHIVQDSLLESPPINGDIDWEINSIINWINSSPNLNTRYSCYGHYLNPPYITFELNKRGFENFFQHILPQMLIDYNLEISISSEQQWVALYGPTSNPIKFWSIIDNFLIKV